MYVYIYAYIKKYKYTYIIYIYILYLNIHTYIHIYNIYIYTYIIDLSIYIYTYIYIYISTYIDIYIYIQIYIYTYIYIYLYIYVHIYDILVFKIAYPQMEILRLRLKMSEQVRSEKKPFYLNSTYFFPIQPLYNSANLHQKVQVIQASHRGLAQMSLKGTPSIRSMVSTRDSAELVEPPLKRWSHQGSSFLCFKHEKNNINIWNIRDHLKPTIQFHIMKQYIGTSMD